MPDGSNGSQWFTVRCVVQFTWDNETGYEERITLWQADSFDAAIEMAEHEVVEYATSRQGIYVGLAQTFSLVGRPSSGAVVFSLIRDSDLAPNDYLDQFFDTGTERQPNNGEHE